MSEIKRYKVVVTGRVQGVGLRIFVVENAGKLNITGWVKNMPDGTVQMEIQGDRSNLSKLIDTIKKGNFIIKVETIDYDEIACVEDEKTFIIKY